MRTQVDWQRYRQEVMAAAIGHYASILPVLGIDAGHLRDVSGPCPGCGGTDRFRYDDKGGRGTFYCSQGGGEPAAGDGVELLRHVRGWGFTEAIDHVADVLGIARPDQSQATTPDISRNELSEVVPASTSDAVNPAAQQALRRAWQQSLPVEFTGDNAVTRYLCARGLAGVLGDPPQDLRLHQSMAYWDRGQKCGDFPVMLAVVRNGAGEPVQLHRTFLDGYGGKAKVSKPKKLMKAPRHGAMNGAAIRLYPTTDELAVTEGIETALAIREALALPVWACVSDSGLRRVAIPDSIQTIQVWADHDKGGAGQFAGARLVQRLRAEGRQADLFLPDSPGQDWLDVLTNNKAD